MNYFFKSIVIMLTIFLGVSVLAQVSGPTPSKMICVRPLKGDQFTSLASVEHVVPVSIKRIIWKNATEVSLLQILTANKVKVTDGEVDLRTRGIDYTVSLSESSVVATFQSESTVEIPELFLEVAVSSLSDKLPLRPLVNLTLLGAEYNEKAVTKVEAGETLRVMFIRCR